MGIKQVVCCDKCGSMIEDGAIEPNGFAFVGNVHGVKNSEKDCVGGGFVGNNLYYEDDQGETAAFVDTITYYCWDCTVKVLFGEEYELKRKQPNLRDLQDTTRWPNVMNSINPSSEDYES